MKKSKNFGGFCGNNGGSNPFGAGNSFAPLFNMFMSNNKNNNVDNNEQNNNGNKPDKNNNNDNTTYNNTTKPEISFPKAPYSINKYSQLIEKHDALSKKIDRRFKKK